MGVSGLTDFCGGILCRLPIARPPVNINDPSLDETLIQALVTLVVPVEHHPYSTIITSGRYFVKALLELRDEHAPYSSLADVRARVGSMPLKRFAFHKNVRPDELELCFSVEAFSFEPRVVYEWPCL